MIKRNYLILIIAMFCEVFLCSSAFASSGTIGMSPGSTKVGDLNPGSSYNGSFTIRNAGDTEFPYKIGIVPYQVDYSNNGYSAVFDTENTYTQMKDWITLSDEKGVLPLGGSKEISFTITVPSDVPSGGQFAAIVAEIDNSNDDSSEVSFSAIASIGHVIYANVTGETRRTGAILENNIPSFLLKSPFSATSLIENTGNIYTNITNWLQVFPLFSDEEIYTNEETPHEALIMPESQRYVTQTWDKTPPVGIFKVRQTVKIFDETSINEKIVVICPLWLICVIVFAIIAAIIWLAARAKSRKKEH